MRRPVRRPCSRGTSDVVESAAVRGSEVIARACVTSTVHIDSSKDERQCFLSTRLESSRLTVRRADMSVETRRSVKSHASDAWKRRLRADVLERVRAHRAALLTRARGDGSSPGDGLRTLLNDGLREILHDAIDTETRRRMSQDPNDSDDGMWDDAVADFRTGERADLPTTSGSSGPNAELGARSSTVTFDAKNTMIQSRGPTRGPAPVATTWNELLALGFTDVEFDALMAEMHRGFEEELREEEAALLALELEKTELRERAETREACERHKRWVSAETRAFTCAGEDAGGETLLNAELQTRDRDEPVAVTVLCPVCLESRLLQTRGSIFCACGGVRLSRADPACEGNAGKPRGSDAFSLETVRAGLASAFEAHARLGCTGSLVFGMKDAFGTNALYAECAHPECAFLEVVM